MINAILSIKINKPDGGGELLTAPVTDRCERSATLMGDDYVSLQFYHDERVILPAMSFLEYNGQTFFLKENYSPIDRGDHFEYSVKFYSFANLLEKITFFRYLEVSGERWAEPDVPINGTLDVLAQLAIEAIVNGGERVTASYYSGMMQSASLKDVLPDTELTSFKFEGVSILDALNTIASNFDTEWYIEESAGKVFLSFGKCESADILELSDRVEETGNPYEPYVTGGLLPLEAIKDADIIQRMIPYGSDRNVIRKNVIETVSGSEMNVSYGKRLRLAPNMTYEVLDADGQTVELVTDANGAIEVGGIDNQSERVELFEDVYPRCKYVVTDVEWMGNADNPLYLITCVALWPNGNRMTEDEMFAEGLMPITVASGLTLSITFESGYLNGRDFEVNWTKSYKLAGRDAWKMILAITPEGDSSDGSQIPMGSLVPRVGDTLQMFNMIMPDGYVTLAQAELAQVAYDKIIAVRDTRPEIKCKSDARAFEANNYTVSIGQRVGIKSSSLFDSYLLSRCTGFSHSLTTPNDLSITICSSTVQGRLSSIEASIADVTDSVGGLNQRAVTLSRRGWRDAAEMADKLDSLAAEMMLIGSEKNQFALSSNISLGGDGEIIVTEGELRHTQSPYTGIHDGVWRVQPQTIYTDYAGHAIADNPDVSYYLYASLEASTLVTFVLSSDAIDDISLVLVGILSSEFEGKRIFNRTYGYTAISGGTITTEQIQDAGRQLIIDFSSNPPRIIARNGAEIIGNIKFLCPDGSVVGGFSGINGGLLMTEMLQLMDGNAVTAGMSGRNDNVLLWGGGTYEDALNAAQDNYKKEDGNAITTLLKKDGRGKIGCFQVVDEDTISVTTDGGTLYISNKEISDFVQQFSNKTADVTSGTGINVSSTDVSYSDSGVIEKLAYTGVDDIPSGRYNLNIGAFSRNLSVMLTNYNGADTDRPRVGITARLVVKVTNVFGEVLATAILAQGTASIGEDRATSRAALASEAQSVPFVNPKSQRLYITYEVQYDYYIILTSGWVGQVSLESFNSENMLKGTLVNVASACVFAKDGIAVIQNSSIGFYVRNSVSGQMQIIANGLPTSRPSTKGQIWNNNGTVAIVQ